MGEENDSNENPPPESAKLHGKLIWIFVSAVSAFAIVLSLYFSNFHNGFSNEHDVWGTFGDFVGGTLNPIFSFLALIALMLTIYIQVKELEATHKALNRSASAHEDTEKILRSQSKMMEKQQFEQTFFALLVQHNNALNEITMQKRDAANKSLIESVRDIVLFSTSLQEAKKNIEDLNQYCGHYYRVLYQLLKFVCTNVPDSEVGSEFSSDGIMNTPFADNEKMYTNMVRAYLNYDVVQVLAINCYSETDADPYWKYRLLIERYSFLEHMPFEVNSNINALLRMTVDHYSSKAFGESDFLRDIKQQ